MECIAKGITLHETDTRAVPDQVRGDSLVGKK